MVKKLSSLLQQAAYEEQRLAILDQILEPEARARLSRLSIVRPDKARATEDALIIAAKNGRLQSQVMSLIYQCYIDMLINQYETR